MKRFIKYLIAYIIIEPIIITIAFLILNNCITTIR